MGEGLGDGLWVPELEVVDGAGSGMDSAMFAIFIAQLGSVA